MVRTFFCNSIVRWAWLLIFLGLSIPGNADLSDRALNFQKQLGQPETDEVLPKIENWIFEKGSGFEARFVRIEEVQKILKWRADQKLWFQGISDRFVEEYPKEWQAWLLRAEVVENLPKWGFPKDGDWERVTRWGNWQVSFQEQDQIVSLGYLLEARRLAELDHGAGKVSGDDLAGLYLELVPKRE